MMGMYSEKLFFGHYIMVDQYADNGAYSHTNLLRKSDGETVIVDCFEQGAKNTEQANQPGSGE